MLRRPDRDEYAAYFDYYIGLVPEGELQTILTQQGERQVALFSSLAPEQMDYRYAQGKWSVKEVLGHLVDTERIMSYRLLRIARGDQTPLVGFDENAFVEHGCFQLRDLSDLLEEYKVVRASTIAQVRGISPEAWLRTGLANGNKLSARTLAYVIAGHEAHHTTILKDRYLG